jgi:Tfp pilus assembly protein PilF
MKKTALALLALSLASCSDKPTSSKEMQQALQYIDKHKVEEGIIHFKNALQIDPQNTQARIHLADALLSLGQPSEAETQYRKAVELGHNKNYILGSLAKSLIKQNKFDQVILEAEYSGDLTLVSSREHALVHALRGLAYIAQNQMDLAKLEVQKSFTYEDNNYQARFASAGILINEGKHKEGLAEIHKIITLKPNFTEAWLLLADIEKQNLNLSLAEKAYTSALNNSHPKSVETYYALLNRALVRAYQDQFSTARGDVQLAKAVRSNEVYSEYVSGLIDFRAQNYQDAANSFSKVISVVPDHMLSHLYLGTTHFIQNNAKLAREHLLYFSKNYAQHPLAEKILAATEMQLGMNSEAEQRLHALVQSEGADPETLNLIGAGSLVSGDIENGIESLKSVLEQKPVWPGALIRVGLGEMERGNFATADKAFDDALKNTSNPQSAYLFKFINYLKSNQAAKALDFILNLNPGQIEPKFKNNLLGIAYLNNKNIEKAKQSFNQALREDDGDPTARHNLASIAWSQGKSQEAISHYQKVVASHPSNIRTHLKLAAAHIHLYQLNEAEGFLKKAVKIDTDFLPARLALVKLYLDTSEYSEALSLLNTTPANQQEHAMVITLKGIAHAQINQWQLAESALRNIKQNHPGFSSNEQAQLLEAYVVGNSQGAGEALALLEKLHDSHPSSRNVINYASANFKTQRSQKGEKILQEWLVKHPNDAMARLTLANYYLSSKKETQALKEFEQIAEMVPNHPLVLNNIAWLLKDTQPKRAYTIIKKALELSPNDERIGNTYQVIKRKASV